jgi:hypothetical protein
MTAAVSNNLRTGLLPAIREQGMQERNMGIVMIKCPQTGRGISTGMSADRNTFNITPVFFARAYCPFCQAEHEWFAKEAWICEQEPEPLARAVG